METRNPSDPHNRRAHRRRGLRQPATLLLPGQQQREVMLCDLGLDGLSVMSSKPIAPGTRCELRFELPGPSQSFPVDAMAKTVYSSFVGADSFRIGLVFTDLPAAAQAAVAAFAIASP
ncbi:MAG: PilZ domain-containing protein [Pseudomonadota bacterium]